MAGELVIQEHEITCPRQYIIVTYLRSIRHRGWDSLIQCYHRWHFVFSSDINDYDPCVCHFRISNLSDSWIRPLLIQLKERLQTNNSYQNNNVGQRNPTQHINYKL